MRLLATAAATAALALAPAGRATAPPVGPLPPGPVSSVQTAKGRLVAVAVPRDRRLSWRLARPVAPRVLRQVAEADVGGSVVLVFRAVGKGRASIVLAATRGEGAKAYRSATWRVRVR